MEGVYPVRLGELAWIEYITENGRGTLYRPSDIDIKKFCEENKLDFGRLWMVIVNRDTEVRGFLLDIPKMKANGF